MAKKEKKIDKKIKDAKKKLKKLERKKSRDIEEITDRLKEAYEEYKLSEKKDEMEKVVAEVEDFVKKYPLVGVGMAFALGYMLSSIKRRVL